MNYSRGKRINMQVDHDGEKYVYTNESFQSFINSIYSEIVQDKSMKIYKNTELYCFVAPNWDKYARLHDNWDQEMRYFLDKFYALNMPILNKMLFELSINYELKFDEDTPYRFIISIHYK